MPCICIQTLYRVVIIFYLSCSADTLPVLCGARNTNYTVTIVRDGKVCRKSITYLRSFTSTAVRFWSLKVGCTYIPRALLFSSVGLVGYLQERLLRTCDSENALGIVQKPPRWWQRITTHSDGIWRKRPVLARTSGSTPVGTGETGRRSKGRAEQRKKMMFSFFSEREPFAISSRMLLKQQIKDFRHPNGKHNEIFQVRLISLAAGSRTAPSFA